MHIWRTMMDQSVVVPGIPSYTLSSSNTYDFIEHRSPFRIYPGSWQRQVLLSFLWLLLETSIWAVLAVVLVFS